jgi:hypothetical protein
VIEPGYYDDIYPSVYDRVVNNAQSLKLEEVSGQFSPCNSPLTSSTLTQTLVLCESVRSPEQGLKALDLIARHLENRAGVDVNDWHHRKKYLSKLCIISIKMQRPDLVFAILGNQSRFQVATYFAREVIAEIAPMGTPAPILYRIAELTKLQRGTSDKGTKQAYQELISQLEVRNNPAEAELLSKAKAELKALYANMGISIGNGAPPPPPPSPPGRLFNLDQEALPTQPVQTPSVVVSAPA